VGLLPAAGRALRLGEIEGSKEAQVVRAGGGEPRPAALFALDQMRRAGVGRVVVVLREGKDDVRAALREEPLLEYVDTPGTNSVVETIDLAHPFVGGTTVALAWPDVLYEPADALARTVSRLAATGADAALGLFPTKRGEKYDLVEFDDEGGVQRFHFRPGASSLRYTWALAAWRSSLTEFLHARSAELTESGREPSMSDVFQAALHAGLAITSERFDHGGFHDIGTPEDLVEAQRKRPS
jgi:dTDP-glucose pyrophosphorylase